LIAGSDAVASMLDSMDLAPAATIPPGIDHEVFRSVGRRTPTSPPVGFLARSGPRRGIDTAVAALERVQTLEREVTCLVAGHTEDELPDWVVRRATDSDEQLAEFYREVAVFILPSRVEGLGLPALEAMACGSAVVVTDNGGSNDYARHGENCLVVPVDDSVAMGDAVLGLLRDDALRSRIATAGTETAATYTWERATDALETVLGKVVGRAITSELE
jgi:glycosyltransferase involved in cell wall biosynthesis